jgi:hypothetical protein
MKKLVFAVLAIGAMAACTKSNVQLEQPGEITLQPVAQKATKAAVDGTYYPTDEAYNFKVWAWWGNHNAGTDLSSTSDTTRYIEEGEFIARNNVSWGGKTPYYWPTKGSLVFAGYSPASAADQANFSYNIADKRFKVLNYIQSDDISVTKDLMWFDVTDKSYDNNGTTGVPVTFKHALSWLTFKFVLNSAITNHTWKITNVELKDVNTKGSFVATKSADVANAGTWTLSGEILDKKDMIVYNSASHTVSTTATTLENTKNGVVVIPQPCVKLFVEYTLTASTGKVISQDVTLDLATGIDDGKWLPGKHYIYTIIFGANEILIAPTVADWVDEPVNIPVQ